MWEFITSLCSVHTDGSVNMPAVSSALFFIGLFSGFLHCSFMCGPFALIQFSKRLEGTPVSKMSELTRLKAASLLPYHIGRIITYTTLGALAGYASISFAETIKHWAVWMLFIAAILIIFSVWNIRITLFKNPFSFITTAIDKTVKPLFNKPTGLRGVALGMILGLLPCGLLYAALATAAASGSATAGATLLAAFALGTIPSLLVITLIGSVAHASLKEKLRLLNKGASTLTACWLALFALVNLG